MYFGCGAFIAFQQFCHGFNMVQALAIYRLVAVRQRDISSAQPCKCGPGMKDTRKEWVFLS